MSQRRLKRRPIKGKDMLNIELEMKCRCSETDSHENDHLIQFAHRYLQCQSSMPIRILRRFIETILPYSSKTKISIFDGHDRLLKDSDRLYSLKHTRSSSNHIPLRFALINTITSLGHCSCFSPPTNYDSSLSSVPSLIQQQAIDQILSTCEFPEKISSYSPCLSISLPPTSESLNVLSPPSCVLESDPDNFTSSFNIPLDLSMKTAAFRLESVY